MDAEEGTEVEIHIRRLPEPHVRMVDALEVYVTPQLGLAEPPEVRPKWLRHFVGLLARRLNVHGVPIAIALASTDAEVFVLGAKVISVLLPDLEAVRAVVQDEFEKMREYASTHPPPQCVDISPIPRVPPRRSRTSPPTPPNFRDESPPPQDPHPAAAFNAAITALAATLRDAINVSTNTAARAQSDSAASQREASAAMSSTVTAMFQGMQRQQESTNQALQQIAQLVAEMSRSRSTNGSTSPSPGTRSNAADESNQLVRYLASTSARLFRSHSIHPADGFSSAHEAALMLMPEYPVPRDLRNYNEVLVALQTVAEVFDAISTAYHATQGPVNILTLPPVAAVLEGLRHGKELTRADSRVLNNAIVLLASLPRFDQPNGGLSPALYCSGSEAVTTIAEFTLFPNQHYMYELLNALRHGPTTGVTSEYSPRLLPRIPIQQNGFSIDRQNSPAGRGNGRKDNNPPGKKKDNNRAQVSQ